MSNIKVGFLPLYLKLYDDTCAYMRPRVDAFNEEVQKRLESEGLELVTAPVCRVKEEFEAAAKMFTDVCAVITLHLAYSPSLESIDALAGIEAPLIVLDTTPTERFDFTTDTGEIMFNHGIHGVQDMCNMLKRRGKPFFIEAGHMDGSDVVQRAAGLCKAAHAAQVMRSGKVGIVGTPFTGMGDFLVSPENLKATIGAEVVPFDMSEVWTRKEAVSDAEIDTEMADDLARYSKTSYDEEMHRKTARMDLMIRKWMEENDLDAYTLSFADVTRENGFDTVPFIEACKAMDRGVGFAGEGDALTAMLCGALLQAYPETSFAEMFCPDWAGGSVFLSHMGEMNERTVRGRMELGIKDYSFSDVDPPMAVSGCFMPGKAVLANLAPMDGGKYALILSEVSVDDVPEEDDNMRGSIHGWIRPKTDVASFLKAYSMAGGTHHLVMVYGGEMTALQAFGEMMGFDVQCI